MTHQNDAFRLSRVYAQGWNAARTLQKTVNPYEAEPERSRWQAGFTGAQTGAGKNFK